MLFLKRCLVVSLILLVWALMFHVSSSPVASQTASRAKVAGIASAYNPLTKDFRDVLVTEEGGVYVRDGGSTKWTFFCDAFDQGDYNRFGAN